MSTRTIHRIQNLPCSIAEAWEFISNPGNLKLITPSFLNFEIMSGGELPMFPGQIISYRVSPVLGISISWVTEITHVQEPFYFVDEQRIGPYRFWHHQHFLREVPGGVEMRDRVHYKLSFGVLGRVIDHMFVSRKLGQIFDYRFRKFEEVFGRYN